MKRYLIILYSICLGIILQSSCATQKGSNTSIISSDAEDLSNLQVIAVMPFANQTRDKSIDWLGAGVADSISAKLSAVKSIVVVERVQISSVIKETELGMTGLVDEKNAPEVGKILGAKALVLGSFAGVKASGKLILRFNCKIVNTETGQLLGGGCIRNNGQLENIFDMEEKIAESITMRVGVALSGAEKRYIAQPTSRSVTAYELYSLALTEPDPVRKKQLLQRSLDYDSSFARAHLSLGYVLYELSIMKGKSPELVKHLESALRKDPHLINAHYLLASYYDRLTRIEEREDMITNNTKKAIYHYEIYLKQIGNSPIPSDKRRIKRSKRRINSL